MRAALVALAAAVLAAGCGRQEPPEARTVVKFGFAAPLTGPQAHYGRDMQNGIVLALEEINAEQPAIGERRVRFELLSEDDQADPRQSTLVAQKLVDRGIAGMLVHFNSGTSIPASKQFHNCLSTISAQAK
jgi:branched-chain amino acid transport system substrate-binding protein